MSRRYIIIVAILCLTIIAGLVFKHYVGDIRPALLPNDQAKTVSKITPQVGELGGPMLVALSVPKGFHIGLFANGLGTARDLQFTDKNTLLVSNPSDNTVTALQDADGDGVAEVKKVVVTGGNHVHGLAFHKGKLYIAELNSVELYSWDEDNLTANHEKTLLTYPGRQNHTNRTLVFGKDDKLYVSLGSNCNVCVEQDPEQGTVVVANEDGTNMHIFAKGQRNAPFLAIHPTTQAIWATGMGRDYLGDNVPPDEINVLTWTSPSTSSGPRDYGWPICYGNKIHDTNFDKKQYVQDPCKSTEPPIYEIPAHSAPLGLAFINSDIFPKEWQNDLLVAYHGSWNRSVPDGYKVVHMTTSDAGVASAEDFITGFINGSQAMARPVDLTFDKKGNLYLSDDKAGNVYIISHQ